MEGEAPETDDPAPENLRAVRAHYAAYAAGAVEELVAGCDPGVAITVHDEHGKPVGETIRGRDGARAFFEGIYAAIAETSVEIDSLRADRDRVLAHVTLGGRTREDDISGTIPAVHLFRLADGLICEIRTHRPDWRAYRALTGRTS